MQLSFGEVSAIVSILAGFGLLIYKFARLEGRVDRLEENVDQPRFYHHHKLKYFKHKR